MNVDFLKNNTLLKVISVVAAIFLWAFVINDGFRVDFLDAPVAVEVINIPPNLALAQDIDPVSVKVRAPLSVWPTLSTADFAAEIDASSFTQGEQFVEARVVSLNSDVQIIDQNPFKVSVVLDEVASVTKDIEVEIQGSPGEDYTVGEASLSESRVTLSGARRLLDSISSVVVLISVEGAMSDVVKTSSVVVRGVNDEVLNLVRSVDAVEVTVPVRQESNVKTVGVKVVTTGSLSSEFELDQLSVSPSVVTIKGDQEVVGEIQFIETSAVNLNAITGNDEFAKALELPDGVEVVDGEEVVQVSVSVVDVLQEKLIDITPQFSGLAGGLSTRVNPARARLLLEGSPRALLGATDTSVQITINLSGKSEGVVSLPVTSDLVTLPAGVRVKDIQTQKFEIVIE